MCVRQGLRVIARTDTQEGLHARQLSRVEFRDDIGNEQSFRRSAMKFGGYQSVTFGGGFWSRGGVEVTVKKLRKIARLCVGEEKFLGQDAP